MLIKELLKLSERYDDDDDDDDSNADTVYWLKISSDRGHLESNIIARIARESEAHSFESDDAPDAAIFWYTDEESCENAERIAKKYEQKDGDFDFFYGEDEGEAPSQYHPGNYGQIQAKLEFVLAKDASFDEMWDETGLDNADWPSGWENGLDIDRWDGKQPAGTKVSITADSSDDSAEEDELKDFIMKHLKQHKFVK
jgi:hypothetical protein